MPAIPVRPVRMLAALGLLGLAAGCSTLSALDASSAALDAYTLTAPAPSARAGGGRARLLVETPTAGPGLGTDRIMVKRGPLQIQYLPDARWIEPAPVLVQSLLVESLANAGIVQFVAATSASVPPDFTLLIDLRDFQAEVGPASDDPSRVVIRMDASLVGDFDRNILAARRFEANAITTAQDSAGLVVAFEVAMQRALIDVLTWTASVLSGREGV